MDSSDWALLLGTLGGGLGGYLGGQKRAERAKSQSDSEFENWKKMVDYERELAAEDRARAKEEAEIAQLESEGRITEGERRGELVDPNSLSNMIFNPGESDPLWEMLAGGAEPTSEWRENMADVLLGTRDYDDPNIRNKENEAFVANPDQNWFNDMSPFMWASMFMPGVGPAALMGRLGLAGAKGLGSLGPKMMGGLSKYLGRGRGAASIPSVSSNPSRLIPNASVYNQGGRVGYAEGTDERGILDRVGDVAVDYWTRLRRGAMTPETYEDAPIPAKYGFNLFDLIGTLNEGIGIQRAFGGVDAEADQRVLNILGDLNPNYDPSVVGTGEILDPSLVQMWGYPQDTRQWELLDE